MQIYRVVLGPILRSATTAEANLLTLVQLSGPSVADECNNKTTSSALGSNSCGVVDDKAVVVDVVVDVATELVVDVELLVIVAVVVLVVVVLVVVVGNGHPETLQQQNRRPM